MSQMQVGSLLNRVFGWGRKLIHCKKNANLAQRFSLTRFYLENLLLGVGNCLHYVGTKVSHCLEMKPKIKDLMQKTHVVKYSVKRLVMQLKRTLLEIKSVSGNALTEWIATTALNSPNTTRESDWIDNIFGISKPCATKNSYSVWTRELTSPPTKI